MSANLKGLVGRIGTFLIAGGEADSPADEPLDDFVRQARVEWLNAQAFFESVSDPDLVDQAIYMIEAAERKYMYLLRKARQERTLQQAQD
ncbi:MAG: YaaL family protein [Chloroflexota bacterium]